MSTNHIVKKASMIGASRERLGFFSSKYRAIYSCSAALAKLHFHNIPVF